MFDGLDGIASLFATSSPPGARRTWREELLWGLATMVFPLAVLMLVLGVGVFQSDFTALLVLPLVFAVVTYALGRRLGATRVATIASALCCVVFCAGASVVAAFLGMFSAF